METLWEKNAHDETPSPVHWNNLSIIFKQNPILLRNDNLPQKQQRQRRRRQQKIEEYN